MASWVSSLRQLATTCAYEGRTEEFIRDQVVERTASPKLRQRLLMEGSGLTLTETLVIAVTMESAERESRAMEATPSASGPRAGSASGPGEQRKEAAAGRTT